MGGHEHNRVLLYALWTQSVLVRSAAMCDVCCLQVTVPQGQSRQPQPNRQPCILQRDADALHSLAVAVQGLAVAIGLRVDVEDTVRHNDDDAVSLARQVSSLSSIRHWATTRRRGVQDELECGTMGCRSGWRLCGPKVARTTATLPNRHSGSLDHVDLFLLLCLGGFTKPALYGSCSLELSR